MVWTFVFNKSLLHIRDLASDIVPGTAEGAEAARAASGAAGARGETVISCAGEELLGVRVCICRQAKKLPIEPQDFFSISFLSYWRPVV